MRRPVQITRNSLDTAAGLRTDEEGAVTARPVGTSGRRALRCRLGTLCRLLRRRQQQQMAVNDRLRDVHHLPAVVL
jgi:hypothetical protein